MTLRFCNSPPLLSVNITLSIGKIKTGRDNPKCAMQQYKLIDIDEKSVMNVYYTQVYLYLYYVCKKRKKNQNVTWFD